MPQARSSEKSSTPSAKAKTAGAQTKRPAARAAAAKSAGASAKPPAAGSTTRATRATGAKATATKGAKTTKEAPSAKSVSEAASTKATSAAHAAEARLDAATHAAEARLDAAAQRVRKLNERIIEAGKEAGETTLTTYEKALKSIAASIERRADSTDVDWISNLATTQAKFIRDVTDAWTKAAREMLKK